jgi:hypothetical protein
MAMTEQELRARVEQLEKDNARLTQKVLTRTKLSCKVGEKGGVSVYGLGRFPVTLYAEQWGRLFAAQGDIQDFIATADAAGRLTHKE